MAFPVLVSSIILVVCVCFVFGGNGQECSVTLGDGSVRGATADTANPNKKVCAYLGIPFAAPPVGGLRFKAPQPAAPFGAAGFNATTPPNWCPQLKKQQSNGVTISEDCLQLNVYVPQDAGSDPLPVMVWIYGGGFVIGSSQLYTHYRLLARGDVILVVPHYRLGILGFFSTGDETSPGNWGLKDQQFAIKWVSENIAAFGGNPNQVTVFGQSAGGASTSFQLISPLNKGLINGVIIESGSALSSWAIDPQPKKSAKIMAARFGCPDLSSAAIVECLRTKSWESLVSGQVNYTNEKHANIEYAFAAMTPVVEPDLPGAFITRPPVEILKFGDIPDIPVVIGATLHDGSFLLSILYAKAWGPTGKAKNGTYLRQDLVPDLVKFFSVEETDGNRGIASSLELAYLNGVNRSNGMESYPGLVDMMSVMAFKSPVLNTAEILSQRNRRVYLYSFEHHSNNTVWDKKSLIPGGVAHSDELLYIFNVPATPFSSSDQAYSDIMVDMWLNFGRFGNPTPRADPRYDTWATYNANDEAYMKLNVTPTLLHGFRSTWRPNGFAWK